MVRLRTYPYRTQRYPAPPSTSPQRCPSPRREGSGPHPGSAHPMTTIRSHGENTSAPGCPVQYTRLYEPIPESGRDALWARLREERSEEHTSELQSRGHLVCRLLLE